MLTMEFLISFRKCSKCLFHAHQKCEYISPTMGEIYNYKNKKK